TRSWAGSINGVDISSLKSIWYRRPTRPDSSCIEINPTFAKLAESEMREVLHGFYRVGGCRVLPHPCANREADYKLLQLQVAAQVGFDIPRTIVTNQEIEGDHNLPPDGDYCIKSLSAFHW